MRTAVWLLLCLLCACPAPTPRVPPVSPEGATPAGPFLPEARALFDGCVPVPDGVSSRTYRCEGLSVWIAEQKEAAIAQSLTDARARVERRLGPGLTVVEGELPLAGQSWRSLRFAACESPGSERCRAGGYLASGLAALGRVRTVGCVARDNTPARLARCLELLNHLATNGNPEGDALDPDALLVPPRLPWRALAVPGGCQLSTSTTRAGRLRCGASSFVWSVYLPARSGVTAQWRTQSVAELAESLPGSSPVEEVPCRLEGLSARCSRFTAPSDAGPLVVWAAAVEWEDRALFAACSFLSSEAPFPAACNGAFSLP